MAAHCLSTLPPAASLCPSRAARAAAHRTSAVAAPLRPSLGAVRFGLAAQRRRAGCRRQGLLCNAIFDGLKKAVGGGDGGGGAGLFSPKYEVLVEGKGYEIRLYDVHAAIECDYDKRPKGIEMLARYMDGLANEEGAAMAPTQPLLMRYDTIEGKKKSMQLYVGPRKGPKQTGTAPPSSDPSLRLVVAGGEAVAVAEFSGNVTPSAAAAARASLLKALERDGINVAPVDEGGSFQVGQFGPLFSLTTRKNEMIVRVSLT